MVATNMSTISLKKRDELILKHIYEYNITLVEIVHQLFFEDLKIGAAESTCLLYTSPSPRD